MHGADLFKAFDTTIRKTNTYYCDSSFGNVIKSDCVPSASWFYSDHYDNQKKSYYYDKVKKENPNGFFVLQFIKDVTNSVVPKLTIEDCYFYNFYQHKMARAFIYFQDAGHVIIKNSFFYKMFFVFGLITNTPALNFYVEKQNKRIKFNIDRGHPYTSKDKGITCKSSRFGMSSLITDDCHLVNITNCNIEKINPYKYSRTFDFSYSKIYNDLNSYQTYTINDDNSVDSSTYNYNEMQEGLLMSLTNLAGKIHISHSKVK